MKKVTLLAASVLAAAMMAPVANAYTPNAYFGGYFRSGVNHGNGGKMAKFNVNKVGRLGNENDNYGEIRLGADLAQVDDTLWTVFSNLTAMNTTYNRDFQKTGGERQENNDIALREFYLNVEGLFDWDKSASVWAGKRFYKREDVGITDMYFNDISGYGAGISDLQMGLGKISLAYIRQDDSADYTQFINGAKTSTDVYAVNKKTGITEVDKDLTAEKSLYYISLNKLDVRYNFPVWDGASMQVSDTYYMPETQNGTLHTNAKIANANTLGVELNIGKNKSVFQWMHGANADGVHYSTGNWLNYNGEANNANGLRFINFGNTSITDTFSIDHVVNIAHSGGYESTVDSKNTYSFVIRPRLSLTKMTSLVWEGGAYYDVVKQTNGAHVHERGQKATMAYVLHTPSTVTTGGAEIRFFVSYIHGTENGVADDGSITYRSSLTNLTSNEGKNVNRNTMFGVQVDAWW